MGVVKNMPLSSSVTCSSKKRKKIGIIVNLVLNLFSARRQTIKFDIRGV